MDDEPQVGHPVWLIGRSQPNGIVRRIIRDEDGEIDSIVVYFYDDTTDIIQAYLFENKWTCKFTGGWWLSEYLP